MSRSFRRRRACCYPASFGNAASPLGMPPTVAHFVPLYLPRTETFIYQVLTHHRRYRPVVLAHHRADPAPLLPLRHVYVEPELQARRETSVWLSRLPGLWRLRPPISFGGVIRRHQARVLHVHFGHTGADVLELS